MQLYIMMGILIQLMQTEKTTAKILSEKFEVSIRSIYRYVDSLSACGVPVCTETGRNGGISLTSTFNLDNMFFTKDELLALKQNLSEKQSPFNNALLEKINYLLINK